MSLGKHLVEEAHEALDAIERDDGHAIIDELGDLLAQVLAVAVIAEERQRFRIAELFQWAADKLVRPNWPGHTQRKNLIRRVDRFYQAL